MIIWINGSFGVGKTETAVLLNKKIAHSYIYDPENIGYFIQDNIPLEIRKDDFQDYKIWRELNYSYIKFLCENYDGTLIIPMTIVNHEYYNDIIGLLKGQDINIATFTLMASKKTIINRLSNRGDDSNSWAANQIDRCLYELTANNFDIYVNTEDVSIEDVANKILSLL